MAELEAEVIQKIIANVNASKTIESGAYNAIIDKLKQLIPSPYAIKSSF
jgi:muramidase (phage lysozyme)